MLLTPASKETNAGFAIALDLYTFCWASTVLGLNVESYTPISSAVESNPCCNALEIPFSRMTGTSDKSDVPSFGDVSSQTFVSSNLVSNYIIKDDKYLAQ
jgi:hypothetical protein